MAINLPGTAYRKALKSRTRLVVLLQEAIDERKASKAKKGDVLEALMEAVDDSGNYLTDEEIIDILVMYLNAGHESSAHTTMWITMFLHSNPQIWKKVQMEQLDIQRRKKPNELLTMNDIREMKYLSKVIDETLRIVNVAPMVFRKALRDVEFRGYTIPKGWSVEPWLRQVHLDPEVYPEPLKFNPDRWDNLVPRPGVFIPFGMGSRLCPGNQLAIMEVSVFVHHMALSYRLEPVGPLSRIIYLPHPRPENNYPVKIRRADDNKGISYLQ